MVNRHRRSNDFSKGAAEQAKVPTAKHLCSRLTPAQQQLVNLVGTIAFGRLENLHVKGGEPVFDPSPITVRTVKFGPTHDERRLPLSELSARSEVRDLLKQLATIRTGRVLRLEIRNSTPCFMEIEATGAKERGDVE